MPSSSTTRSSAWPPDYAAAREKLAHRCRSGVVAVEGADREAFLQGQLTQDVRGLAPGQSRPAAGLTARGKILYFGTLVAEPDRLLLLLAADAVPAVAAHLAKYAAFQKASVRDATADYARVALYGPDASAAPIPPGSRRLEARWEHAGEILAPGDALAGILAALADAGSVEVSDDSAEALRIEAGRPRLHRDATEANVIAEIGLDAAVSAAKGCYVGQEIVARMRTYAGGKAPRRLAGFRFVQPPVPEGTVFPDPEKSSRELARITSTAASPRLGAIGLGLASRDLADGAALTLPGRTGPAAVVCELPFS